MKSKLLLFDIDGTLITGRGIPRRTFFDVARRYFPNLKEDVQIQLSGKTDPLIVEEILVKGGYGKQPSEELVGDILDEFVAMLEKRLQGGNAPEVLPGVHTVLEEARSNSDFYLGLVTGNVSRGAYVKLKAAGLYSYFPVGAFGDDSKIRSDLPPLAIRRCQQYYRRQFSLEDIWIIGDSIYDVRCAHDNGLPCLAVAGGKTARTTLAAEHPEILIDRFDEAPHLYDLLNQFQL